MSPTALQSPSESAPLLAALFCSARDASETTRFLHEPVVLSVREDTCFGNKWLSLGNVTLKSVPKERDEPEADLVQTAIRFGFFEWKLPPLEELQKETLQLMGIEDAGEKGQNEKAEEKRSLAQDKTRRALQSIIDVSRRLGLLFPHFDADVLAQMPFRRPTSVVADTSAIGQGGVDFLIRFLWPMARLKIPALVPMEIMNQSDRFFKARRSCEAKPAKPAQKADILLDHVVSQGGQRAMLRFELHSDMEIERTALFSDPLRNAFAADKDKDWPDLNLSAPVKSYCDRLILETARQHLSSVSPGHPVLLITGDEGQARMALSEGIPPLFFHAGRPARLYGRVLSGTRFHPFSGEIFSIPLYDLLWELAVTFGSARLASADASSFFEVRAIAQDLNWQPFHAKDDLLRVTWDGFTVAPSEPETERITISQASSNVVQGQNKAEPKCEQSDPRQGKAQKEARKLSHDVASKTGGFRPNTTYRFDLDSLLRFIPVLLQKGTVSATAKGTPLQEKAQRTLSKYWGFLATGGFIDLEAGGVRPTELLQQLWEALTGRDLNKVSEKLRSVPSLTTFFDQLRSERLIRIDPKVPESQRPSSTYVQIAELCGHALLVPQEGLYGTFSDPLPEDFVTPAIETYESLRKGEDYVLTGLWLEALARDHGIHPTTTRDRLAEAHAAGMIERYTQGSTPDTRFDKHTLAVLQVRQGRPEIDEVCLYHGDFIIPGKASVSIRLEKK